MASSSTSTSGAAAAVAAAAAQGMNHNNNTNTTADKNNNNDMDMQMQQVLQLLSARTKGQATNEEVEQAVSNILSTAGLTGPGSTAAESDNNNKKKKKKTENGKTAKIYNNKAENNVNNDNIYSGGIQIRNSTPKAPVYAGNTGNNINKKINVDTEDYDDFDEDNKNSNDKNIQEEKQATRASVAPPPATASEAAAITTTASTITTSSTTVKVQQRPQPPPPPFFQSSPPPPPAPPAKRKRGRPRKGEATQQPQESANQSKYNYDHIPLGKQGSSMMTTFGDGPHPLPNTVSAALLGARRLLQVTIQDARALRRKAKQQFKKAQVDVAKDYKTSKSRKAEREKHLKTQQQNGSSTTTTLQNNKTKPKPNEPADPHMLYRALQGHDKLAYEPKCGFDYDQLSALFPEEMRAYARWNQVSIVCRCACCLFACVMLLLREERKLSNPCAYPSVFSSLWSPCSSVPSTPVEVMTKV